MSTRFIPERASEPAPPKLEAQQALLIDALRRAEGRPVSYGELRDAGVELPASVVSELELAGIPIERCFGGAHGERRVMGVRLVESASRAEPARAEEPAVPSTPEAPDANPVRIYRSWPLAGLLDEATGSTRALAGGSALAIATGSVRAVAAAGKRLRTPSGRVLAPLAIALGVAGLIVVVLVAGGLSGAPAHHRQLAATHVRRQAASTKHAATPAAPPRATATTTPAPQTPPTPVSPALATQLEAQGHALLAAGQYADAIRVLRRAVAATGVQENACLEPSSSNCLTYAYALYDLGHALRLSGNSAAAVPILEARLQIDNQRSVVASELRLARQQAG